MSAPDLKRVSAVFEQALCAPPDERERVVREACGGDEALAGEVRSLLAHHERAEGFLAAPALGTELHGDLVLRTLGRYRILGRLGAGGMGVVYLAEQDNPRRKVALKVLRPGASGTSGRFAHEAELLGRLQHPGIAQIHEAVAGDPERGIPPYFAMEYVEGRALDAYATEERLGLRARLTLLVELCEAVQHAHQKGVVHRDLKPANVLVDAAGRPKVLDFGVARVLGDEWRAATLRTNPGEIVGTLAYMSPEQAAGDPERLDTRADVYALGVVAYELLGGRLPFALERLSLTEAVRMIQGIEPARLGRLRRELAGDLETIVAKAMAKEPERRYASASELGQDLARFLADEPIAARPPSALYQLRKFARRHSALVGGAAACVLLLAVGIVVVARQAARLAEQRDLAEGERGAARAAETRAEEQRLAAERESAEARAVSGFLEDVLAAAEPYVAGREASVADAVRWAEERADERFADRPDVLASLKQRLASIHYSRGELDAALAQAEASLALRSAVGTVGGDDSPGQADEESADPLALAASLTTSGTLRQAKGELHAAEDELRRAVKLFERHAPPEDPRRLTALTTLSAVLFEREAYAEAEPMMRGVLELRIRVHGPEHAYTLTARNNLAQLLMRTGRATEGEAQLLEVLEVSRRVLSERHPNTIQAIYNYADALRERGAFEEAAELFQEAIELGAQNLPAGHWMLGLHRSRYGELLAAMRRPREAEVELRAGYEILETALGPEHARTQRVARALVEVYRTLGDPTSVAGWSARVHEDP